MQSLFRIGQGKTDLMIDTRMHITDAMIRREGGELAVLAAQGIGGHKGCL